MDLEQLKAICAMLQEAWTKTGGNRLLLLPWAVLALVELYKHPLTQRLITARWPGAGWDRLTLGAQLLVVALLGSLPVFGAQLLLGVGWGAAAVSALVAGATAALGYKPARSVATTLLAPLASRVPPSVSSGMGLIVPLDVSRIEEARAKRIGEIVE